MSTRETILGQMFYEKRVRRGWSVNDVAQKAKLSEQQYRNIENGSSDVVIGRLQDFCEIFGIPLQTGLAAWLKDQFSEETESRLPKLIGHWLRKPDERCGAMAVLTSVAQSIDCLPIDAATARFLFQEIIGTVQQLNVFRRDLIQSGSARHYSPQEIASGRWKAFLKNEGIEYQILVRNREGLGYFDTLLRIEPQSGIYRKTNDGIDRSAGMVFYSVLGGNGRGFHETQGRWYGVDLVPTSGGHCPAELGHAIFNNGESPLVVRAVFSPFPPDLMNTKNYKDGFGIFGFTSSSLDQIRDIPGTLKQILRGKTEAASA